MEPVQASRLSSSFHRMSVKQFLDRYLGEELEWRYNNAATIPRFSTTPWQRIVNTWNPHLSEVGGVGSSSNQGPPTPTPPAPVTGGLPKWRSWRIFQRPLKGVPVGAEVFRRKLKPPCSAERSSQEEDHVGMFASHSSGGISFWIHMESASILAWQLPSPGYQKKGVSESTIPTTDYQARDNAAQPFRTYFIHASDECATEYSESNTRKGMRSAVSERRTSVITLRPPKMSGGPWGRLYESNSVCCSDKRSPCRRIRTVPMIPTSICCEQVCPLPKPLWHRGSSPS